MGERRGKITRKGERRGEGEGGERRETEKDKEMFKNYIAATYNHTTVT